jgi:hypothetical protein
MLSRPQNEVLGVKKQLLHSSSLQTESNNNIVKVLVVRTQAILYACTYLCSFVWVLIAVVGGYFSINSVDAVDEKKEESTMVEDFVTCLLLFRYPLQGFLNFLVIHVHDI